jgi:cystathionine gamma-synthase
MAAATTVVLTLDPPAHILAPEVMYWALRHWLTTEAPRYGYRVDLVDMGDPAKVAGAVKVGETKLIWIETPANPLWTITDVAAIAEIAYGAGALLAVDSTVATPVFAQPLALGADIVMHSATKYLNGHSDVVAGVLAAARKDAPFWQMLTALRARHGAILGPFEAWLLMRGLRTLDARVRIAAESAAALAAKLTQHPALSQVLYPGLPAHPGHAVAARQMVGGFGGMLSIRVKAGERAAIDAAARVAVWKRATSLGGVESLIEHRASVEGFGSPCPPDLLRLSVGLEDPDDLYLDLDRALRAANA